MSMTLVVSVGTDHHRFERMLDWIDEWMSLNGDGVELFVQHGESRPSRFGENASVISHADMMEHYLRATAVVTQGGPGGILDAAGVGIVPIVIPRRPDLGEHVDAHQVSFTRFMARSGGIVLAESKEALFEALDGARENPETLRQAPRVAAVEQTASALERVIEDVMSRPAGFVRFSRFRRPLRAS